jgi:hypothetical protein
MWMFVVVSSRAGQTVYKERIRHSIWGAVRIYTCFHDAKISCFELPKALTHESSLSQKLLNPRDGAEQERAYLCAVRWCAVHVG